jgi:hypothetical protein
MSERKDCFGIRSSTFALGAPACVSQIPMSTSVSAHVIEPSRSWTSLNRSGRVVAMAGGSAAAAAAEAEAAAATPPPPPTPPTPPLETGPQAIALVTLSMSVWSK